MACVALQILGGHPQYAFFVAIAAGLHALVYAVAEPEVRRRTWWVFLAAYLGGAALAAMQILPGLAATAESVRAGKLTYDFARIASLPPENLLTVLAPGFFGHLTEFDYWGRIYLWEGCLFAGVTGLVLAVVALVDRERGQQTRLDLLVAGLLLVLALGDHTPLQRLLYDHVPGFGQMRSLAKFSFPFSLFVALAIGAGADALIRQRSISKRLATGLGGLGLVAAGLGVFLWLKPASLAGWMEWVQNNRDAHSTPFVIDMNAAFIAQAGGRAGEALAIAGALLALAGIILLLAREQPRWSLVLLALLPVELLVFAGNNFATAQTGDLASKDVQQFLDNHPGDYRVLDMYWVDAGYFYRVPGMWDDSPGVLKRYAEFFYATQGANPDEASQYIKINSLEQIFSLVRFRYAFLRPTSAKGYLPVINPNPLPRALLVTNFQVLPDRDAILAALMKPDFDPRNTVYLENEPSPLPEPGGAGTVKVTVDNSDQLTIEADTPVPTLLLITDLYSRDWFARALPGSVQQEYTILPADYVVRAIPLAAGHHHLAVVYDPPSFRHGLIISGVAWMAWAGAFLYPMRRVRRI